MVPLVFYLVAAGRHFSHRHRASLRPYNPPFRLNEQREYPQNVGIFAVSVLEIIKQNLKEKKKAQKANYHTHTPKYMRVGVPCFFFALFHILIFSLSIVFVTNSFLFKKKTGHREGNVRTFRSPFIKIEVNNFLANFFFFWHKREENYSGTASNSWEKWFIKRNLFISADCRVRQWTGDKKTKCFSFIIS